MLLTDCQTLLYTCCKKICKILFELIRTLWNWLCSRDCPSVHDWMIPKTPAPATACYQPLLVPSSCVGKPGKRLNSHQDFLRSGKFYSSRRKISLFTENSIIWTGLFEKHDGETWSYWCLRRPISGILQDMSLNICSIFCWSNRWLNK